MLNLILQALIAEQGAGRRAALGWQALICSKFPHQRCGGHSSTAAATGNFTVSHLKVCTISKSLCHTFSLLASSPDA